MKKLAKETIGCLLTAVLLVSFASCSSPETTGGEGTSSTGAGESAPASTEGGDTSATITVGIPSGWLSYGDTDKMLEEYPNATVEVQAVEDDQFDNLLMARMATNEAWDVFMRYTGTQAAKYTNIEDLSNEEWVSRLDESVKPYLTQDGKIVCAPTGGSDILCALYNKTLFDSLDLTAPTNREEFEAVCETLKANGITPIAMGTASGAGWMPGQLMNSTWGSIAKANDEGFIDKLNKNEMQWSDVKTFPETLAMWADWAEKGYFNENMASDDVATCVQKVGEGEAGMIFTGGWQWSEFNEKYPDVEIGGFPLPAASGESAANLNAPNGMYVSSTSSNVQAAKDLVAWLCEPEQLERYYDVKPDISAWSDIEVKKLNPVLSELQPYVDSGNVAPHWNSFYVIPYAEDMSNILFEMISGQKTPEDTLNAWQDYMVKQGKQLGFEGF